MVVTSSNNKAVENVSAELPALNAVAQDAPGLRYFKAISDKILGDQTWGMISAVLGNAGNRYGFSQSFWRDDEVGMSAFLHHACGVPQIVSEPQDEGPPIKRNRKIVDLENPAASARQANGRWINAKRSFEQGLKASEEHQYTLQAIHIQIEELVKISAEIDHLFAQQPVWQDELSALRQQQPAAGATLQRGEEEKCDAIRVRSEHNAQKLGFFGRLFKRKHHQSRLSEDVKRSAAESKAEQDWTDAKAAFDGLHVDIAAKEQAIEAAQKKIETLRKKLTHLEHEARTTLSQLGVQCPDAKFFAKPHEEIQKASV